jgi:hypothetical protein
MQTYSNCRSKDWTLRGSLCFILASSGHDEIYGSACQILSTSG